MNQFIEKCENKSVSRLHKIDCNDFFRQIGVLTHLGKMYRGALNVGFAER